MLKVVFFFFFENYNLTYNWMSYKLTMLVYIYGLLVVIKSSEILQRNELLSMLLKPNIMAFP